MRSYKLLTGKDYTEFIQRLKELGHGRHSEELRIRYLLSVYSEYRKTNPSFWSLLKERCDEYFYGSYRIAIQQTKATRDPNLINYHRTFYCFKIGADDNSDNLDMLDEHHAYSFERYCERTGANYFSNLIDDISSNYSSYASENADYEYSPTIIALILWNLDLWPERSRNSKEFKETGFADLHHNVFGYPARLPASIWNTHKEYNLIRAPHSWQSLGTKGKDANRMRYFQEAMEVCQSLNYSFSRLEDGMNHLRKLFDSIYHDQTSDEVLYPNDTV